MLEKKTILNRGEIDFETNIIGIRFAKIIVEDGVELSREWHRTSLPPGADIDNLMTAVNNDLARMKQGSVDVSEIDRLKTVAEAFQTPDVIAEFQSRTK